MTLSVRCLADYFLLHYDVRTSNTRCIIGPSSQYGPVMFPLWTAGTSCWTHCSVVCDYKHHVSLSCAKAWSEPGLHCKIKTVFPVMYNLIVNIRPLWHCLIFIMGVPILVRLYHYIEAVPWCHSQRRQNWNIAQEASATSAVRKKLLAACNSVKIDLLGWCLHFTHNECFFDIFKFCGF